MLLKVANVQRRLSCTFAIAVALYVRFPRACFALVSRLAQLEIALISYPSYLVRGDLCMCAVGEMILLHILGVKCRTGWWIEYFHLWTHLSAVDSFKVYRVLVFFLISLFAASGITCARHARCAGILVLQTSVPFPVCSLHGPVSCVSCRVFHSQMPFYPLVYSVR